MHINKAILIGCFTLLLAVSGCSRQQSDWEKTRAANTTDAYELFLKKYPSGEFTAQAQARVKELYEMRDWQKARDTDTAEAYQAYVKQYPEGQFTDKARMRVEDFAAAPVPSATPQDAGADPAPESSAPAAGNSTMMAASPMMKAANGDSGPYGVQLGAFKASADAANKRWSELALKFPRVLGGLSPKVAPKTGTDGTLYRLQVANLSEKHARAICKSLQASAQPCLLVPPA